VAQPPNDFQSRGSNKKESSNSDIAHLNTPPHSIEAEQAVLGSIMQSVDAWDKVAEILIQEDFYNRSHRVIFAAITRLISKNSAADPITLKDELETNNELEDVGGFSYIVNLARNTPSSSNISAYANIVRERAVVRELIGAANDIADISFNPEGRDSKELLDLAETKVFEIAEKRTAANEGPISVSGALRKTISRIEELAGQDKEVTGVSTGFTDLDKKTSGLQPSDLIIVAARPSMGKCIVSGSNLVDPRSGAMLSIDHMVRTKNGCVSSLNNALTIETQQASEFVDDGIKPVFKVTTALGKEIETTITHPFLSGNGWQALADLKVGDAIAVPRSLPIFGNETMSSEQIKALAYGVSICLSASHFQHVHAREEELSLANSSNQANSLSETNSLSQNNSLSRNNSMLQDAARMKNECNTYSLVNEDSALELEQTLAKYTESLRPESKQVNSRFKTLYAPFFETANNKALPQSVFTLPKSQMRLLLNRLFACHGHLFSAGQEASNITVRLNYVSQSFTLIKQVQHLLLRMGIVAQLSTTARNSNKHYALHLVSHEHVQTFLETIGISGKQQQIGQALALLKKSKAGKQEYLPASVCDYVQALSKGYSWQHIYTDAAQKADQTSVDLDELKQAIALIQRKCVTRHTAGVFARIFNDSYLQSMSESQLYWDRIVSIEATGQKQVYDLSVPQLHNFIAQDICVHNTTFAMNLVENALLLEEKPVLVFSLEMPAEQIMMRMLASLSRVNQTSIRTARLEDTDWARIQSSVKMLNDKDNLFIDDSSGLTPMEVRTRARKLARDRGGISMIMIDYLQLMRVPSLSENRTLEISEISRSLKALAKELECPVIALSQLNRGLEQRADKRPINSDLRESGAIEQDADLIMFIYRDEVYHENSEHQGIAEIIIGKQRNGPIGTTRLTFQGQFSRFDNYAGPAYDEE